MLRTGGGSEREGVSSFSRAQLKMGLDQRFLTPATTSALCGAVAPKRQSREAAEPQSGCLFNAPSQPCGLVLRMCGG